MIVVTMVATLAATAVAWQSKQVEVQLAERARTQAMWLLRGAMDWSRLLLRQDAQSSGAVDHLAEPWAVPLQETKLSAFVSADGGVQTIDASADMADAFLAGEMQDLNARLNLAQIDVGSDEALAAENAIQRLFRLLSLPQTEYVLLLDVLQKIKLPADHPQRLLAPRRVDDLRWFGLSLPTVQTLNKYAYWANVQSTINLNTASAVVIQAASNQITQAQAQALVSARLGQHFQSLSDAQNILEGVQLPADVFDVKSAYFQAQGWVRMDGIAVSLQAQLSRSGDTVTTADVAFQGVALP